MHLTLQHYLILIISVMSNSAKIQKSKIESANLDILNGQVNPLRTYHITTGQSESSKDVMFVLYACPKSSIVKPTYLGTLAINFDDAIIAARKKVPMFQIEVDTEETFSNRREVNTLPFGKYKGMTIEQVFDVDPKYIFWLSGSDSRLYIKSKNVLQAIEQYGPIAKELIVTENKARSTSIALTVEEKSTLKTLTCYKSTPVESDFLVHAFKSYFADADGNKYAYTGGKKFEVGATVDIKCKIVSNYEALGILFNVIKLR